MEGHPYAMRLTPEEKNLVDDLSKKNVKPHDILSTIKQQNVNNCSSLKTIYNAREKIKMIEKQGLTEMQVFIALLHKKGFIFEPRVNENNVLEDFFFAHPLSLELWHAFPQVLLLDATYKTNRFNMPFLEIVSVTSTNLTFCVAFAFLCKEMKDNYEWVLNCLKSTLDERVCPRVIVTDRAYALMNACETVFLDAKQLLCRWHISQSVFKFGRPSMKSPELWDSLDTAWKSVVLSSTVTSYVRSLKSKPKKTTCVDPPTQEPPKPSQHNTSNFFSLHQLGLNQEATMDDYTISHEPARHSSFSHQGFDTYMNHEQARHSSFTHQEVAIYSSYLHQPPNSVWEQERVEQSSYLYQDPSMHKSHMYLDQSIHGAYMNQTHGLFPQIDEPIDFLPQIPKFFRNHVSNIQNVRSDGNCGFRAVAVCLNMHEDSWPQIRLDLWSELNEHEEYYTHIFGSKDVSNIYRSLNFTGPGPAPEGNWLVMPDTGLLIASRYNRVVQYLNIRGSNTLFPLWSSPPKSQRHESIVIALVHGMHFVKVDLRGDYPMPYVHPYWKTYKLDCASGWEHHYSARLNTYIQCYRECRPEYVDF